MIKCGRPRKGDELLSRDRLLDAALQLFLEHGYENLSMENIARDARVSLRTIYSQFGGKSGLFGALVRRCSDRFIHSLEDDSAPEQALVTFARQFLYSVTRPEVVRMRAILIGESARFPDIAIQFYEQGPARTLSHLAEFFQRQQQAGRIVAIDAQFLAEQYISSLRSERFQRLQLGLETTPDAAEIDVWVEKATALFLSGCLVNGGSQNSSTSQ